METDTATDRVHLHRDDYPDTLRLLEDLLALRLRQGAGDELGFERTESGAWVDWDRLVSSHLSSTEVAVAHITRGVAVLERSGGPSPRLAKPVADTVAKVCTIGRYVP